MEKIRIQDDLYTYVNREKLEELVIPEDMPMAGGFATLQTDVEKLMIGELNTMCAEGAYPNEHLARACTLFSLAKDVKRKKKHGIKPALKNLAILKKLGTMRGYNLHTKELILKGIAMPISIAVEPNMKDTAHHCVMIQGPSVILPDASYYNSEQRDTMLGLWSGFAKQVLEIAGHNQEEIDLLIKDTLEFDAGDLGLESLGRLVQLSVTLQNVCPNRQVALAAVLTEVDDQGSEYKRGMKTLLIPAHTRDTCQNMTVRCIKFVLPESLNVSGETASMYSARNFRARFIANYIDDNFECCTDIL
jgi:hypothetical protein